MTGTEKALTILRGHPPLLALEFASLMWPNSPGWLRTKNIGNRNTSVRGLGMARAASGMLGRLKRQGLVRAIYRDGANTLWTAEVRGRVAGADTI